MTRCSNILLHIFMGIIGGFVYMGIEMLWRGHTHWTMGLIGGISFVLIGILDEVQNHPPILLQMVQGACIVTMIELFSGLILNIWLGLNIWDYSNIPCNLMGQVCLPFTIAWFFLSWAAIRLENLLHAILERRSGSNDHSKR